MRPPADHTMPEPRDWSAPLKICTVERLRRSAISPSPRMSVAPGTLRDGNRNLPRLAAAQDFKGHALAHRAAFQRELDIVGILDGLAAELDEDIADEDAGLGGGSLGFQ